MQTGGRFRKILELSDWGGWRWMWMEAYCFVRRIGSEMFFLAQCPNVLVINALANSGSSCRGQSRIRRGMNRWHLGAFVDLVPCSSRRCRLETRQGSYLIIYLISQNSSIIWLNVRMIVDFWRQEERLGVWRRVDLSRASSLPNNLALRLIGLRRHPVIYI